MPNGGIVRSLKGNGPSTIARRVDLETELQTDCRNMFFLFFFFISK